MIKFNSISELAQHFNLSGRDKRYLERTCRRSDGDLHDKAIRQLSLPPHKINDFKYALKYGESPEARNYREAV